MARIPYVDKEQLSPEFQPLLKENYSAFRALAHSPEICSAFRNVVYTLKVTGLSPRLRELAMLRVGWLSQCRYEWFHHVKTGMENGVSEEDIRILMEDTPAAYARLDEAARLTVLATEQMYAGPAASAEVVAALDRLLGTKSLVELLVAMGFYIGTVRILSSLELDLEPQYEPFLARFPLKNN